MKGKYPLSDGRGNVRQSTDGSQSIISANARTAFGIGSVTGGTASAYSYGAGSGYRQDGIAPAGLPNSYALQKVGARYYDPAVGGFLTRDTDLSQSPYAYCDGDPVNFTDPSGHLSAVNIAAGSMQIMGVSGGAADAPVDTSGDNTVSTPDGNGGKISASPKGDGTITDTKGKSKIILSGITGGLFTTAYTTQIQLGRVTLTGTGNYTPSTGTSLHTFTADYTNGNLNIQVGAGSDHSFHATVGLKF